MKTAKALSVDRRQRHAITSNFTRGFTALFIVLLAFVRAAIDVVDTRLLHRIDGLLRPRTTVSSVDVGPHALRIEFLSLGSPLFDFTWDLLAKIELSFHFLLAFSVPCDPFAMLHVILIGTLTFPLTTLEPG